MHSETLQAWSFWNFQTKKVQKRSFFLQIKTPQVMLMNHINDKIEILLAKKTWFYVKHIYFRGSFLHMCFYSGVKYLIIKNHSQNRR